MLAVCLTCWLAKEEVTCANLVLTSVQFGSNLDPDWDQLGLLWGLFRTTLTNMRQNRPTWASVGHLGVNLGHLGPAKVVSTWAILGPSWGQLGANLGPKLGLCWTFVGQKYVLKSTLNTSCFETSIFMRSWLSQAPP